MTEESRPMKYPYTLSAKIAQFPFQFYFKHSWAFKYWLYACVVATPIFYKLQKLSHSPANVKHWRESDMKLFHGSAEH